MNQHRDTVHIVVDLETAGLSTELAPILQIAACHIHNSRLAFFAGVSLESNSKLGRIPEGGTLAWWNKQNPTLRAQVFSGTEDIVTALEQFNAWLESFDAHIELWSRGADFDCHMLEEAYSQAGLRWCVDYRSYNCIRTVCKHTPPPLGGWYKPIVPHNALFDATADAQNVAYFLDFVSERRERMAIIVQFPEEIIELNKELASGLHPTLEGHLARNPEDTFVERLARIAAYCSIPLDGYADVDQICNIALVCRMRLEQLRERDPNTKLILH